ncbi:MAG: DUF86 domain-containing protein [Clostridiales bacterium]|nr:DUF86 domain-containing protein [Clostridiales bacterium]
MGINRDRMLTIRIHEEAMELCGIIKDVDYNGFMASEIIRRAICMTLLNIGELQQKLSDDYKRKHGAVPWAAIRKTRNVIAHEYDKVDWDIIWNVSTVDIKELAGILKGILKAYDAEEGPFDIELTHRQNIKALEDAEAEYDEEN